MAQNSHSSLDETLNRLSSKSGVRSTLILSKTDGAIIRSTGLLTEAQVQSADAANGAAADGYRDVEGETPKRRTAEEVAKMVFSFVNSAAGLAGGMEEGDEVQLLRLRTRRNEFVIVPDAKYLLVVIHDAPKPG